SQSAVADVDYIEASGVSEIDPGQTSPAIPPSVAIIGNDTLATDKVFYLDVTSPDADIVDPNGIAIGTIANDDPDLISVDASRANVTQTPAGTVAFFTVSLASPVANNSVTVNYTIGAPSDTAVGATPQQILDGSAKLGAIDYL